MKRSLFRYKKAIMGIVAVLVAAECRLIHKLTYGVYEVQKKVICQRIFNNLDDSFFVNQTSRYGQIYFTSHDKEYSKLILSMVDLYYPILSRDFGCEANTMVSVVVYPDKKQFGQAIGVTEEEIPMGAYYGGLLTILSPKVWIEAETDSKKIDQFLEDGPIVHELTHLVLDQKLKGNYDLWFTEGVALYYEKKYTGFEWRPDLKVSSQEITLDQLEKGFFELDEAKAYRRSLDLIEEIVSDGGESRLQKIIESIGNGKSYREARKESYN